MKTCPNADCPERELTGGSGGFRDEIEVCPFCSTPLAHDRGAPTVPPESDAAVGARLAVDPNGDRAVVVLDTDELFAADIAGATLNQAGIPFYRRAIAVGGIELGLGGVVPTPGQRSLILVPPEAETAAREALAGLFLAEAHEAPGAVFEAAAPPASARHRPRWPALALVGSSLAALLYGLLRWLR